VAIVLVGSDLDATREGWALWPCNVGCHVHSIAGGRKQQQAKAEQRGLSTISRYMWVALWRLGDVRLRVNEARNVSCRVVIPRGASSTRRVP